MTESSPPPVRPPENEVQHRRANTERTTSEEIVRYARVVIPAAVAVTATVPWWATIGQFFDAHNGTFNALFSLAAAIAISLQVKWMRRTDARIGAQIELARKEFAASHRPELIVRSLLLSEVGGEAEGDALVAPYKLTFWIVNKGRAPAVLIAFSARVFTGLDAVPKGRNELLENPTFPWQPPNVTIAPGEPLRHEVTTQISMVRMAAIDLKMDQRTTLFLLGRLVYADESGTRREVGFLRKYDIKTGASEVVNDPACEYSD